MKQVSVETAFGWTQGFAAREWPLLLPVALVFFGLPGLLVDVLQPNAMQALLPGAPLDTAAQGRALMALAAMLGCNMVGGLAITALALVPGISVQEALGRAIRRLPSLLGALMLVTMVLLVGTLVVALLLGGMRLGGAALQALLLPLLFVAGGVLWVRFSPVTPILVERRAAPLPALRQAWALTGGAFWRLLSALALYFVGGTIVLVAVNAALGTVILLGARAAGVGAVGTVLAAVLFRLVAAVVSTGFQLLIAAFYRQLSRSGI